MLIRYNALTSEGYKMDQTYELRNNMYDHYHRNMGKNRSHQKTASWILKMKIRKYKFLEIEVLEVIRDEEEDKLRNMLHNGEITYAKFMKWQYGR